jgi:hypothetical protein
MTKTFTLLVATAATAIGLLVAEPAAATSSVTCNGTLDPVVSANVVVPAGGFCALDGASVTGNVFIGPGAIADLAYVSIDGNVQSSGAALIFLKGFVTGNVAFSDGGQVQVVGDSFIGGNLQVNGNTGGVSKVVEVTFTEVGKNLEVNDNQAGAGGLSVFANTVGNNLSCAGNNPAPVLFVEIGGVPFGNTVAGDASEQCDVE